MEIDKLKQWLDITKQYQSQSFWNEIFDHTKGFPEQTTNNLATDFFSNQNIFPRCDMYVKEENIVIEAELPGVEKQDIKVFLQENELIIRGQCKTIQAAMQYYIKERPNRAFEKKLTIPVSVNRHDIQTYHHNGILTIILPMNHTDAENIPIMFDDESSALG